MLKFRQIQTKTLFKWSLIKPSFDDRQKGLIKMFETTLINDVINGARERRFKRRLKGLKMMLEKTLETTLENDVRKRRQKTTLENDF